MEIPKTLFQYISNLSVMHTYIIPFHKPAAFLQILWNGDPFELQSVNPRLCPCHLHI